MHKTRFRISKLDCSSEEQLIRLKLQNNSHVESLAFDISNRLLIVYHNGGLEIISSELESLNLGCVLLSTENSDTSFELDTVRSQRNILWIVLLINFLFFVIEIVAGIVSESMGLIADSLDMLADSIVYGLALYAVGGLLIRKKKVAKTAGYFQILLAVTGFSEIIRRYLGVEEVPEYKVMIVISVIALAANVLCLYLMLRNRSKEVHMQASVIFTSNDVVVNSGVILAGFLVHWFDSNLPDLIIGAVIFVIVARGAYRILRLG